MRGVVRSRAASWLKELPRVILIALFAFAAVDKLFHLNGFVNAIHSYRLLPSQVEYMAAVFFVMAELAIAFGLLTRRWRRSACLAAVLLLSVFTIVYLVARPEGICGCWFTLTLNTGGYFHILQNLVFIGLAILIWFDSKPSASSSNAPLLNQHTSVTLGG
ncbi:MAG TPA: MauE/DoxX family redox-associated membrane protein [Pyrinomonadaceae bacterium]|jgi:uncharacterized membrane protein YphA (DoxX/SURF4 family)